MKTVHWSTSPIIALASGRIGYAASPNYRRGVDHISSRFGIFAHIVSASYATTQSFQPLSRQYNRRFGRTNALTSEESLMVITSAGWKQVNIFITPSVCWRTVSEHRSTCVVFMFMFLQMRLFYSSEREFLIDASHKKSLRVCPCAACTCQIILVLVWKNCLGFSVGYQRAPGTSEKKKERLVPASASLPTAGSALPRVGRATPLLWCSDVNTTQ